MFKEFLLPRILIIPASNRTKAFRYVISLRPSASPRGWVRWIPKPSNRVSQEHSSFNPRIYALAEVILWICRDDFRDYVEFCFQEFGDRVKHWITVNEPNYYSSYGYAYGVYAPGRCSDYMGNCSAGDSATEPYTVGHNLLLSHAAAVKLYKEKHQVKQELISIASVTTITLVTIIDLINRRRLQSLTDYSFLD